ncbi:MULTISPECIES: hypothetical protein [unclassified Wolbachia]|uniref:Uncharacterized protein n=1 Tax=Wolbachia endosymbiont of Armadillidium arcangelii TaxID=3158571 RepID=A0AAU7Q2G4_9RICK|nr:hypothetical protein [Wolbachia endosymbiont of Armadillidium vulgare]
MMQGKLNQIAVIKDAVNATLKSRMREIHASTVLLGGDHSSET